MHNRKTFPPMLRDVVAVTAIVAVLIAVVRPALVTAQGTVNSQLCIGNLKALNICVIEYTQDYDEKLPPLNSPLALAKGLKPYAGTTTSVAYLLTCPLTQRPYTLNTAISGQAFASLPGGAAGTLLAQDSAPHTDGKSTIEYVDGTITYGGVNTIDPNVLCVRNAKSVGLALLEYTQDYDGSLPVYHNSADLEAALLPYSGTNTIFTCPETGLPFVINRSLSGKSFIQISNPATTKLLQDARPHPNGDITTAFLDGHAVQVGQ